MATQFDIKNFNTFITDDSLAASGVHLPLVFKNAYVASPIANIVREFSGFSLAYWPEYCSYNWIDFNNNLPDSVTNFTIKYHIAAALTLLHKESATMENFTKIVNIVLGKPFAIITGKIEIDTTSDVDYFFVKQFIDDSSDFIVYKLNKEYLSKFPYENEDVVERFSPLLEDQFFIYEALRDKTWFSSFNNTLLTKPAEDAIEYDLNINRVVAIHNIVYPEGNYNNPGFNYSPAFLFYTLKRITRKDIILLFKQDQL